MNEPTEINLKTTLNRWILRLRLQRAFKGLFAGFFAGLVFCSFASLYTYFSNRLLENEFLRLAGFILVISTALGAAISFAWPADRFKLARNFDLLFGLKERVSTALEIQEQGNTSTLESSQLLDAAEAAKRTDFKLHMPFKAPGFTIISAIILLAANAAFWFYGADVFSRAQQKRQIQTTIEQQIAGIEALIEEIQENPDLDDETKADLITPLQDALENLNEANSLEEAFSALEEAKEQLNTLENPGIEALSESLQEAGTELAALDPGDLESFAENLSNGAFEQAAEDLQNLDLENMEEVERQTTAEKLEKLADAMEASDPELAQSFSEAASAAAEGDVQSAQEALEQAAEAMESLAQQATASSAAQQAANQLEQNQAEIVNAGQQGTDALQAAVNGNQGEQGNQSGPDGNPGGSGAGDGSADGGEPDGENAGNSPIDRSNNPDGIGESTFQPISPSSIGGDGSDWVAVPPSGEEGDNITGIGPADFGSTAPITVPYIEVFQQYQNNANQAVESGEIPPQYRELIREYFSSLEP